MRDPCILNEVDGDVCTVADATGWSFGRMSLRWIYGSREYGDKQFGRGGDRSSEYFGRVIRL
jgi:hypothetical protein